MTIISAEQEAEMSLRIALRRQLRIGSGPEWVAAVQVAGDRLLTYIAVLREQHREWCVRDMVQRTVWEEVHPNHCRGRCQGSGQIDDSDPSVGMYGFAPCPDCVEQGICPWCGQAVVVDDEDNGYYHCDACGFVEEKGATVPTVACFCPIERGPSVYEEFADLYEGEVLELGTSYEQEFAYDAWRERQATQVRSRD
jgi:hypothetical protein